MHYLNKHNIIHYDIKPNNIFIKLKEKYWMIWKINKISYFDEFKKNIILKHFKNDKKIIKISSMWKLFLNETFRYYYDNNTNNILYDIKKNNILYTYHCDNNDIQLFSFYITSNFEFDEDSYESYFSNTSDVSNISNKSNNYKWDTIYDLRKKKYNFLSQPSLKQKKINNNVNNNSIYDESISSVLDVDLDYLPYEYVHLGDFGLSWLDILTDNAPNKYYCPPEKTFDNINTCAVDVWSFGCILYELLTLKI